MNNDQFKVAGPVVPFHPRCLKAIPVDVEALINGFEESEFSAQATEATQENN